MLNLGVCYKYCFIENMLEFEKFKQDMIDFASKSVFTETEKTAIIEFADTIVEESGNRVRDIMAKLPSSIRQRFNDDFGLRDEFQTIIKRYPSVFIVIA